MKTDTNLLDACRAGAAWLRTPGCPELRQALPFCATSALGDAWIVGAWSAYWTGAAPDAIRTGRGRTYHIYRRGRHDVVRVVAANHRDGVNYCQPR